ncbi:MAG: glutathione peroxidase [Burkholderiales bacterium]|nr:glutathione peroxidase [Burkholderiales bacterium]
MPSLHDFSAESLAGKPVKLSRYKGKLVLVVNTASQCGLTPQYKGLEALYGKYRERGLEIVGFPCNQFGGQEPGTAEEIGAFCERNYGVSFPMMAKVEVNGEGAHPLYKWLTSAAPGFLGSEAIKWNFTKFLVGPDGAVIKRYAPQTDPADLARDIEGALA